LKAGRKTEREQNKVLEREQEMAVKYLFEEARYEDTE
jgi:hypothetical protein